MKGIIFQGFVILLVLHFSNGKEEKDRAGKICKFFVSWTYIINISDVSNKICPAIHIKWYHACLLINCCLYLYLSFLVSFFNIVSFPNDPCDAGTYNGTCYTKWVNMYVNMKRNFILKPNSPAPLTDDCKVTDDSSVNFHDVFFFIFCQIIAKNEEKHVMEIYGWVVRNFPVVRKCTRWIQP